MKGMTFYLHMFTYIVTKVDEGSYTGITEVDENTSVNVPSTYIAIHTLVDNTKGCIISQLNCIFYRGFGKEIHEN